MVILYFLVIETLPTGYYKGAFVSVPFSNVDSVNLHCKKMCIFVICYQYFIVQVGCSTFEF